MISLRLNGIQHFVFCPRQWGLIEIEEVWEESSDTAIGRLLHKIADDAYFEERRSNKIITRAVPVFSKELGLHGVIDVLEYRKSNRGIVLPGEKGIWIPYIIEYKKGKAKTNNCDKLQLVAQVMCLEEMFKVQIKESALYYKATNKKYPVLITEDLRKKVIEASKLMHELYYKGQTPKPKHTKACEKCSLKEKCWPRQLNKRDVSKYIEKRWSELS